MKARLLIQQIAIAAAVVSGPAVLLTQAQVVMNSASTVGQSYAEGMSDMVRSAGAANLMNSKAAINMEQALKADMENQEQWTKTIFEMRKINTAAREAERGPRTTMEDAVRYAQMGKPQRLSPSDLDVVSGKIAWPSLLQADLYSSQRNTLQDVFTRRAKYGTANFNDQMTVRNTTSAMLGFLKDQIRNIPPQIYMASKRFLESLAYEAQLPTG